MEGITDLLKYISEIPALILIAMKVGYYYPYSF